MSVKVWFTTVGVAAVVVGCGHMDTSVPPPPYPHYPIAQQWLRDHIHSRSLQLIGVGHAPHPYEWMLVYHVSIPTMVVLGSGRDYLIGAGGLIGVVVDPRHSRRRGPVFIRPPHHTWIRIATTD